MLDSTSWRPKDTYLIQIAIGKETRAAGNCGPAALPATLGRIFKIVDFNGLGSLEGALVLLRHLLGILGFSHGDGNQQDLNFFKVVCSLVSRRSN